MLGAKDLDWEELKSFAVVADAGSIRRAARELGVHHSTISRRIDNLEYAIGAKLFLRQPEGYVLSAAGEDLVTVVRECGVRLNVAERLITGQDRDLSGTVTATMAGPVAELIIAPRLAEFAEMHPGIEVRIAATTQILDISRHEADVAVRVDNNPPQSLVGKRLFPYYEAAYASQAYLDAHDFEAEPEAARWISWKETQDKFIDRTKEAGFGKVPLWGYFPDPAVQRAAARAGLGLALLPCFIGDADPELVRASERRPLKARHIWLLTHSDLRRTARIRAFMDFAEKVLREAEPAFQGIRQQNL
ncbi:LysR substrate-binding domain-containing protein [Erythrobacter sp. Alg231-14]|uniref:LysR substrate-binding domain-containing protein n=1 Tax=Erythrobacter sp. Alg231-14 TaxID=1922225 RepID=UPI000D557FDD